jgi:hypothetical protein
MKEFDDLKLKFKGGAMFILGLLYSDIHRILYMPKLVHEFCQKVKQVKVVAPRHGDVDARKGSPFDVGCLN